MAYLSSKSIAFIKNHFSFFNELINCEKELLAFARTQQERFNVIIDYVAILQDFRKLLVNEKIDFAKLDQTFFDDPNNAGELTTLLDKLKIETYLTDNFFQLTSIAGKWHRDKIQKLQQDKFDLERKEREKTNNGKQPMPESYKVAVWSDGALNDATSDQRKKLEKQVTETRQKIKELRQLNQNKEADQLFKETQENYNAHYYYLSPAANATEADDIYIPNAPHLKIVMQTLADNGCKSLVGSQRNTAYLDPATEHLRDDMFAAYDIFFGKYRNFLAQEDADAIVADGRGLTHSKDPNKNWIFESAKNIDGCENIPVVECIFVDAKLDHDENLKDEATTYTVVPVLDCSEKGSKNYLIDVLLEVIPERDVQATITKNATETINDKEQVSEAGKLLLETFRVRTEKLLVAFDLDDVAILAKEIDGKKISYINPDLTAFWLFLTGKQQRQAKQPPNILINIIIPLDFAKILDRMLESNAPKTATLMSYQKQLGQLGVPFEFVSATYTPVSPADMDQVSFFEQAVLTTLPQVTRTVQDELAKNPNFQQQSASEQQQTIKQRLKETMQTDVVIKAYLTGTVSKPEQAPQKNEPLNIIQQNNIVDCKVARLTGSSNDAPKTGVLTGFASQASTVQYPADKQWEKDFAEATGLHSAAVKFCGLIASDTVDSDFIHQRNDQELAGIYLYLLHNLSLLRSDANKINKFFINILPSFILKQNERSSTTENKLNETVIATLESDFELAKLIQQTNVLSAPGKALDTYFLNNAKRIFFDVYKFLSAQELPPISSKLEQAITQLEDENSPITPLVMLVTLEDIVTNLKQKMPPITPLMLAALETAFTNLLIQHLMQRLNVCVYTDDNRNLFREVSALIDHLAKTDPAKAQELKQSFAENLARLAQAGFTFANLVTNRSEKAQIAAKNYAQQAVAIIDGLLKAVPLNTPTTIADKQTLSVQLENTKTALRKFTIEVALEKFPAVEQRLIKGNATVLSQASAPVTEEITSSINPEQTNPLNLEKTNPFYALCELELLKTHINSEITALKKRSLKKGEACQQTYDKALKIVKEKTANKTWNPDQAIIYLLTKMLDAFNQRRTFSLDPHPSAPTSYQHLLDYAFNQLFAR